MVKVSVIIPAYNASKYLATCIDSVLQQIYKDYEIIIVNDGSIDSTSKIAMSYKNKYDSKIKYIYQKNRGLASARNAGIRNSVGEYIAILDSDDVWLQERLSEEVKILENNTDIGLVHSNVSTIDTNGNIISNVKREKKYLSGWLFKNLLTQKAHISCPTVLFRRNCCEKVGMFDEALTRLTSEDRDLWVRISKVYKIYYIDKVLAYYRVHSDNMSNNKEKMFKGITYVIDKHCTLNGINSRLRKYALSRVYRDMGDQFLFNHAFKDSKKCYIKSLSYKPSSFWPFVNFIKASLKIKVKK